MAPVSPQLQAFDLVLAACLAFPLEEPLAQELVVDRILELRLQQQLEEAVGRRAAKDYLRR